MKKILTCAAFIIGFTSAVAAEVHEVGQLNKEFTVEKLKISKGDTVKFTNQDPFFHNVFSLSDAALFDLGSFPKGEFKEVTFDESGEVEVECAIHPNMRMTIEVKD
mgnify:CR=1 FL=1